MDWKEYYTNWREPVSSPADPLAMSRFQNKVRTRFINLATALDWNKDDYDLYAAEPFKGWASIYLHHDTCFLALYPAAAVMGLHTCRSRKDRHGRPVALMRPEFLDDIPDLASNIRRALTLRRFTGEMRPVHFSHPEAL